MHRVQLQLKKTIDNSYDVHIERGLLRKVASDLRMKRFAKEYVVITDKKVNRLYGKDFLNALKREDLLLGKIVVPAGESSKSFEQLEDCLEQMVKLGATRNTAVIALGGGVVGDLAGFVAASFMRGVPFIQVPTTLLAMVDSSVGGKVGIDLESGKNLAGAFLQPEKVYIDPDVLQTLPQKQWKAGLGEAVKYGAIKDRSLWEFFQEHVAVWNKKPKEFLPSEWKLVEDMIQRSVQIKTDVVMRDEKEGNLRQILNYGHTFGHVIELISGYTVLHGEAVATGMRMAAAYAEALRIMPSQEREKQDALLDALKIGKAKTKGLIKDFIKHMKKDKKSKGDVRVVLVARLGYCHQDLGHYGIKADEQVLQDVLKSSGLIDDKQPAPVQSSSSISTSSSVSTSPQSNWKAAYDQYSSTPSTSSSATSAPAGETDLQRRLREMRERAAQRRQSSGGGGFLPG